MQFLQRRIHFLPLLCRWRRPPALARRDATTTLMPTSRDLDCFPRPHNRLSRFVYKSWRTCTLNPIAPASTSCLCTLNGTTEATKEPESKPPTDDVHVVPVITNSSHRDGLIYKNKFIREDLPEGDIANRNETQLEPMRFSKATERCFPDAENCMYHFHQDMFQFFSVLLSKSTISTPSIQLYGYIAARDVEDGMLNYVVNYSRDDPVIVQQGSLIEMTGPKRGIRMTSLVLIEFDMRIKNGMQEDDDEQLIDGAISCYDYIPPWKPYKHRVIGNCGAVDMLLGIVDQAVEATIEVTISELQSGLSLSLSSFVAVMDEFKEIKLFHGNVVQTGTLRRFVVAVTWYSVMVLNFKVSNDVSRQIIFEAKKHGYASRQIKLKAAAISVKVTWSTI